MFNGSAAWNPFAYIGLCFTVVTVLMAFLLFVSSLLSLAERVGKRVEKWMKRQGEVWGETERSQQDLNGVVDLGEEIFLRREWRKEKEARGIGTDEDDREAFFRHLLEQQRRKKRGGNCSMSRKRLGAAVIAFMALTQTISLCHAAYEEIPKVANGTFWLFMGLTAVTAVGIFTYIYCQYRRF